MFAIKSKLERLHLDLGGWGSVFLASVMLALAAGVYLGYTSSTSDRLISERSYAVASKSTTGH